MLNGSIPVSFELFGGGIGDIDINVRQIAAFSSTEIFSTEFTGGTTSDFQLLFGEEILPGFVIGAFTQNDGRASTPLDDVFIFTLAADAIDTLDNQFAGRWQYFREGLLLDEGLFEVVPLPSAVWMFLFGSIFIRRLTRR